ncbi:MAG: hypothetical protein US27_C0006G0008 [Candidatus Moranbacteria bacterium GW2011_GWF1_36_78]|nr:MAG: hypothetical protein US27_C0006G0008 [Candidatus Moranbacteria bacterium GW2011_GWF1_36_78]
MEQKNKKNLRASLIVIISILAFVLVVMLVYKNKKSIPQVINQKIEKLQNKEEIGLFDVVKNKDVEIQYNSTTNEVILVEIK